MADGELPQIGPYTTTKLLGVSSTSRYYLSKSTRPKKDAVHIKYLTTPLTSKEAQAAFLRRVKQLKKFAHRDIVAIQDGGLDNEYGYIVTEAVTGETLRHVLSPGKQLAPLEAKPLLSVIAETLHQAHVNNIIHGNLHPGTISISLQQRPLITEFSLTVPGITPLLDDDAFAIPYMSPEQLRGEPLTPASDQYALAAMVYEWLCGRRPYDATERDLLLEQQEHAALPQPSTLNSAINPVVEQVLLQALSIAPEKRFANLHLFSSNYLRALMRLPIEEHVVPEMSSTFPDASATTIASSPVASSVAQRKVPVASAQATQSMQAAQPTQSARSSLLSSLPPKRETQRSMATSANALVEPTEKVEQSVSRKKEPAQHQQTHQKGEELESQTPVVKKERTSSTSSNDISPASEQLQATVTHDLRQDGVLSRQLPGYEERPAQIEMATLVSRSLMQGVPSIIEAGTGTGKSLAYLLPVVRSGKVAIVSTANKALQEQLFYKDIPFIQQHIQDFEAALVKGVNNYICLDRLETERVGMQFYAKNPDFKHLVDVVNDPPDENFIGDFETLGFQLPSDIRAKVATDSDQCAWSKCGFFADCYVRMMREQAERAQVIVVNHTLLLLDAAIGGFLLPERDVIILDEAHHLEEEATRSFTITIGPAQIQTLLAQKLLRNHSQLSLQDEAMRISNATWMRLAQVADPGFKGRINLEAPLEEGLKLATTIADLADSLRKQRPKDLPEKEGQLYDKLLKRTQNLAENIRTVFSVAQPAQFVYYVERVHTGGGRNNTQLQVSAAPLDVTNWLRERLFDKCNVICTSATLATIGPNPAHPEDKGPNFAYFRKRIGLDPIERPDVLETILPLAFDYEQNALLYIPRDLPEPTYGAGSDDYMKSIAREMYKLVKASRGRAFLLFSSKRMMDRAYELMSPHLPYPLLKQGDMTRLELTRRFREEEGSVLFGLKSFWEGVDIAGEALSLVVIDKLPFDPPDDPVHEARVAQMKAAGENWFGTYVLPQAVLRLKQGIGRLLRTREDRGVMAILDTRLHTKGYGKMVLNALPPAKRTMSIKDVEKFFA